MGKKGEERKKRPLSLNMFSLNTPLKRAKDRKEGQNVACARMHTRLSRIRRATVRFMGSRS